MVFGKWQAHGLWQVASPWSLASGKPMVFGKWQAHGHGLFTARESQGIYRGITVPAKKIAKIVVVKTMGLPRGSLQQGNLREFTGESPCQLKK